MKTNFNLKKNTFVSLLYQLIVALSGFILPRFFITQYGSVINGSISTISQIAGFLGLLEAGMGSVASVAFYKAFSSSEGYDLTVVRNTIRRYYRIIALISISICTVLAAILPFLLNNGESFAFNLELVLIVSCGYFIQYYFGITSQLMLAADYKAYVNSWSQIISVVLNFTVSIWLINMNVDIRLVKLVSFVVMLARPIIITAYVKARYRFSSTKQFDNNLMKQRWNNLGQSIAFYIHCQTDMIIILLFLSVAENSIYAVYMSIITAIKTIITAIVSNFNPILGRTCAKKDSSLEELCTAFSKFSKVNNFLLNVLFSTTAVLIIPFMQIYSQGFDRDYIRPTFALLLCLAEYVYLLRNPYNTLIIVNGHFKETQVAAYIEAGLNIVLSVILINFLGIIGVAIGTGLAMLYRLIYCIVYTKKKLLNFSLSDLLKPFVLTGITFFSIGVILKLFDFSIVTNYITFAIAGVCFVLFFSVIQLTSTFLLYRKK